jgi:hypothetical protein
VKFVERKQVWEVWEGLVAYSEDLLVTLLDFVDDVVADFGILSTRNEFSDLRRREFSGGIYLTHSTKSPRIVVESLTRNTPPSRSFISMSVASVLDIDPKYQLK